MPQLLYHLPCLSFTSISSPLHKNQFFFPKTGLSKPSSAPFISSPLFSSLTSSGQIKIPLNSLVLDQIEETQAECTPNSSVSKGSQIRTPLHSDVLDKSNIDDSLISKEPEIELRIEKLFIPPEVNVSADSSLKSRILKGSNIVLSGYARDAKITQADFVKSSARTMDCPSDGLPEFALVRRSNVGKLSLLNSLVRRKQVALTSKRPDTNDTCFHKM